MCDIILQMYESGKVDFPDSMSSGIMGPCISIGIFDSATRSGYMRHQPNADHDSDMEEFIVETLKQVSQENVKVYITGGAYDINDNEMVTPESVRGSRCHVENLIRKYFDESQVTINWVQDDKVSELILYTKTGKFKVIFHIQE